MSALSEADWTREALAALLRRRLDFSSLAAMADAPQRGDHDLNPHSPPDPEARLADAAVLVPIVTRAETPTVLLTRRPESLTRHAGQVAFPGGRVDPGDDGPIGAALREASEEVGLDATHAEVVGTLDPYRTGTGFRILPVVALVAPEAAITIDRREVAEAFEVPFTYLMDARNHERRTGEWRGETRHYYAMPYGRHFIWGATAGILVNLHHKLFRP